MFIGIRHTDLKSKKGGCYTYDLELYDHGSSFLAELTMSIKAAIKIKIFSIRANWTMWQQKGTERRQQRLHLIFSCTHCWSCWCWCWCWCCWCWCWCWCSWIKNLDGVNGDANTGCLQPSAVSTDSWAPTLCLPALGWQGGVLYVLRMVRVMMIVKIILGGVVDGEGGDQWCWCW